MFNKFSWSKTIIAVSTILLFLNQCSTEKETCTDGIKNQTETGIDCGGLCKSCDTTKVPTCFDGIKNQNETEIDCGGACQACVSLTAGRDSALKDYTDNYLSTDLTGGTGWTGNVAACTAGSISQATLDKTIKCINYFRRMVGLNDNTTLDPSQFSKYQETALMMEANASLNHAPPSSWKCYTALGADGAVNGNLHYSLPALINPIYSFIKDDGSTNTVVGHRRWLLFSATTKYSVGMTAKYAAIGVIGIGSGNTKIPAFIAYPPKGFVPAPLIFDRWSFGIPDADFANAIVKMKDQNGIDVPLSIISRLNGYGDNTIIWEPTGINKTSVADVNYTVTISKINTTTPKPDGLSFTYDVIIFKP